MMMKADESDCTSNQSSAIVEQRLRELGTIVVRLFRATFVDLPPYTTKFSDKEKEYSAISTKAIKASNAHWPGDLKASHQVR